MSGRPLRDCRCDSSPSTNAMRAEAVPLGLVDPAVAGRQRLARTSRAGAAAAARGAGPWPERCYPPCARTTDDRRAARSTTSCVPGDGARSRARRPRLARRRWRRGHGEIAGRAAGPHARRRVRHGLADAPPARRGCTGARPERSPPVRRSRAQRRPGAARSPHGRRGCRAPVPGRRPSSACADRDTFSRPTCGQSPSGARAPRRGGTAWRVSSRWWSTRGPRRADVPCGRARTRASLNDAVAVTPRSSAGSRPPPDLDGGAGRGARASHRTRARAFVAVLARRL